MDNTDADRTMNAVNHPVFAKLTAEQHTAFERHTVLHELDQRVEVCPKSLAQKVHAFVERGVPYFAPTDRHYRAWAAEVAKLWETVEATRANVSAA
jgi:TRAP-type C4-dicarboxylate transport system substrate-binding protein